MIRRILHWLSRRWNFISRFKNNRRGAFTAPPSAAAVFEQKLANLPLTHHWWRLYRPGGEVLRERIKFYPDGRVTGFPNADLAKWKIEHAALHIVSAGLVTTTFNELEGADPAPVLKSNPVPNQNETYLLSPNLTDLHVEIFQTRFCGDMLVVPTSRGRPFDGMSTRWELWHLPREAGIDHMRLAEHVDSRCWYTNKTARIMAQLRIFVAQGYRSFCFFGLSSGGYAAMLLAELLASEFAGLQIRSVAINPQTQLGDDVKYYFSAAGIAREFWPDLITDEDLAQADIAVVNLKDAIHAEHRKSDVQHHVFYDAGNACEQYFAGCIDAISSVKLHRFWHGLPHADGISKIYQDNRDEIERLVLESMHAVDLAKIPSMMPATANAPDHQDIRQVLAT